MYILQQAHVNLKFQERVKLLLNLYMCCIVVLYILPISGISVLHMPVAVRRVFNS